MLQRLRTQLEKFVRLPEDDWQALAEVLYLRKIPKKEYFIKKGEQGKEIGLVLQGAMHQFYEKEAEERSTYFFFEDMLVTAYISCLTGQKSELSIQALEDCEVLCFKYADWLQLGQKSTVYQQLACKLAEYIAIGLEERMVSLLIHSPEERYLQLLASNKKRIMARIPQHYIASYLGITPVSLSRIRNRITQS